jgi:hypothetical protein
MRKIIVAFMVALCLLAVTVVAAPQTATATSYQQEVMLDTPGAYWRLSETGGTAATDSAGNNNIGTYHNGILLGVVGALTDQANKAATADGTDDYISVPDSATLSPAQVTVEAWVKVNAYTGSFPRIVSKDSSYELTMYTYAGGQGRLEWKITNTSNVVTVATTAYADRLLPGNWYHIVGVYNGTAAKVYINGVEKASSAATGNLKNTSLPLYIARDSTTRYLAATLDEVAVYGTALSAGRIADHYDAQDEAGPPQACLGVPAYPEIRPGNTLWNGTRAEPLNPAYREHITGFGPYYDQVDGEGCVGGTTEQILEWAAIKWGFDAIPGAGKDLFKAAAVRESDWYQRVQGDFEACTATWCFPSPGYYGTTFQSTGISGVKRTAWPDSADSHISTAFAADYHAAAVRAYYDGAIPWASGAAGSVEKAIAAWYCGCGDGFPAYSDAVMGFLAAKTWETEVFKTGTACSTNCAP